MQLPRMAAAERHRKFIANFETQGARLRKLQVMRIGWLAAADKTRLRNNKPQMRFVVATFWFGNRQNTTSRSPRPPWGWRQGDLAKASGIGLATIARIEQGKGVVQGNFSTIVKIQQTLERAGISFIDDPAGGIGVRLYKPER